MHGGRGYRGWGAASTVAVVLSLMFLAVEKHISLPRLGLVKSESKYNPATTTDSPGIILTVDPGLAGTEEYPRTDLAPITRSKGEQPQPSVAQWLRRPPEPAATVKLEAPIATFELIELPLHANGSGVEYLMEALDNAFDYPVDNPLHTVSANRPSFETPSFPINADRLAALPSPASVTNRIPEPTALLNELSNLQQLIDPRMARIASNPLYVSAMPSLQFNNNEANAINHWIVQVQSALNRIVIEHGLEHDESREDIQQLSVLATQAQDLGNALGDYNLATRVIRTGYSLQRRVAVWQAIQGCLDGTTIALIPSRSPDVARRELVQVIDSINDKLSGTGDAQLWRNYLMLDDLAAWVNSPEDIWTAGSALSQKVLSRLHWSRLSDAQKRFLAAPEFQELAAHLVVWGRDPIDYRQLLVELEEYEQDPISRVGNSLAGATQALRLSGSEAQQAVASSLNDHYRNANVRISVSGDLLARFLPNGNYEVRPVRKRILGADTQGDSAIKTQLSLNLIPDPTSWNIKLGVAGDMVSMTKSSKGPAEFHNTSTAQITSHRYIKMNQGGYQVSSEPTNVLSQDYLRNMSTDYDNFPVVGDFVRLIVREQFDQKRGLAQRITRRMIAEETDSELDRRLDEGLRTAEKELEQRLIGPLQRLHLNPMVVAMETTEERLVVRYRVANETQMSAHTPRPRAPRDSLLSMQVHQTTLNNAIAQIGLSGKTWTLPELYQRLGEVFHKPDIQIPAELEQDINIRFADTRPATVELEDGKLRLTLRIAELSRPGQFKFERFYVSTKYVPVADGLTAELIRSEDDVVEIQTSASRYRDRMPLRFIFAKIFVSRPEIPLINQSWGEDERAQGLAVSQVEIRDGWLAVAISNAESSHAAEVAERARAFKLQ